MIISTALIALSIVMSSSEKSLWSEPVKLGTLSPQRSAQWGRPNQKYFPFHWKQAFSLLCSSTTSSMEIGCPSALLEWSSMLWKRTHFQLHSSSIMVETSWRHTSHRSHAKPLPIHSENQDSTVQNIALEAWMHGIGFSTRIKALTNSGHRQAVAKRCQRLQQIVSLSWCPDLM